MSERSCSCGANTATAAAYRQMSPKQRDEFDTAIRNCPTCKQDKRNV